MRKILTFDLSNTYTPTSFNHSHAVTCMQRRPAKKLKSLFGSEEDVEEEEEFDDEELGTFAGDFEDEVLTDDFADGGLQMDEVGPLKLEFIEQYRRALQMFA